MSWDWILFFRSFLLVSFATALAIVVFVIPFIIINRQKNESTNLNGDIMNKTVKDKEYIDFPVSPYALADVLLALDNEGIKEYWVTKEDNDLHIRIEKDCLREKVYKVKLGPLDEEKNIPTTPFNIKNDPRFNQASQPNCETCPYKGGLKDAFGNPVIGDSPCDFCPSNPLRVICSSEGK